MTARHTTVTRRRVVAVLALALIAALTACVGLAGSTRTASAASLAISARSAVLGGATRCASSPVTVASASTSGTSTTTVRITGLTAADAVACAGRTLTLRVVDAGGNQLAIATTTTLSTSITLAASFTTASVAAVVVDLDSFALPTTWTPPVPTAGATCELRNNADGSLVPGYTCTAEVAANNWVGGWSSGSPITSMTGQIKYDLRQGPGSAAVPPGTHVAFTATFPSEPADSRPVKDVNWSAGTVTTFAYQDPSSGRPLVGSCSQLPTIIGQASRDYTTVIEVTITFDGTGSAVCS